MMKHKKGYNLRDLLPLALMFVVTTIAISIGAQVVSDVAVGQCLTGYEWNTTTDTCTNSTDGSFSGGVGMSYAANASHAGLQGLGELGSWLPTIALIVAAAIVIGVLVFSFAMGGRS